MSTTVLQIREIELNDLITFIKEAVASEFQNNTRFKTSEEPSYRNNLLTRKETKELLQTSYTTLWNYSKQGFLRPKRIGGRVYYLKSEILSYLENENNQSKTWER